MEARFMRGVINALTWFIIGMVMMGRFYSAKYNPAGGDYIGWDMVAVVLVAMGGIHLLLRLDPSFREE